MTPTPAAAPQLSGGDARLLEVILAEFIRAHNIKWSGDLGAALVNEGFAKGVSLD